MVSYIPIADSEGKVSGNISIDPQIEVPYGKESNTSINVDSVQILGCNVGVRHGTTLVSAESGTLARWPLELDPSDAASGFWSNWTAAQASLDPMLGSASL